MHAVEATPLRWSGTLNFSSSSMFNDTEQRPLFGTSIMIPEHSFSVTSSSLVCIGHGREWPQAPVRTAWRTTKMWDVPFDGGVHLDALFRTGFLIALTEG